MKVNCSNCGLPFEVSIVAICPHCHQPESHDERAERIARENEAVRHPSGKGPRHRARQLWYQRPHEFHGVER